MIMQIFPPTLWGPFRRHYCARRGANRQTCLIALSLPKQQKNPILIKEGKTIFDEKAFRGHFTGLLQQFPIFPKKPLLTTFRESLKDQQSYGRLFPDRLAQLDDIPYTRGFLHTQWPNSFAYKELCSIFLHYPILVSPFIQAINQYFYYPALKCWRDTQKLSYFPNSSDYCARALPGSREAAQDRSHAATAELMRLAEALPPSVRSFVSKRYPSFFDNRWAQFGGGLLPCGYLPGKATYGRLRSVPPSSLCNMKKDFKLAILGAIKARTGISFMEVDLKSCHAKIFESYFNWEGFDRSDLPELDRLWPAMIKDFWLVADCREDFREIKDKIREWSEAELKGLLKNQFYKSLNGGMPDYADDNVERSSTKLRIAPNEQPLFNEFFHEVFGEMKVFKLLTAFIEQVNAKALLYLPNSPDGFRTSTLSKVQTRRLLADPFGDYEPRKQTANSRLFSNLELCLILHLYSAIVTANCGWLVIGYEADGILVAGEFSEDQAFQALEKVNKLFKASAKRLTPGEHALDIKNFV